MYNLDASTHQILLPNFNALINILLLKGSILETNQKCEDIHSIFKSYAYTTNINIVLQVVLGSLLIR